MVFNLFTLKLKLLIYFSKQIPKDHKHTLKSLLINEKHTKSFNKTKFLFSHQTFFQSYDILTSSILALHYNNSLSLEVLNRAQLETFLFTSFLCKFPQEIKNVFSEKLYGSKKYNEFIKNQKSKLLRTFNYYYNTFYSQKAHPLPTRLIGDLSFYSFMKPKDNKLDFSLFMNQVLRNEFNKLPEEERIKKLNELFEKIGLQPSIKINPHISKESKEKLSLEMIYFYRRILENLNKIEKKCPSSEMSKLDWENAIRKYKRD